MPQNGFILIWVYPSDKKVAMKKTKLFFIVGMILFLSFQGSDIAMSAWQTIPGKRHYFEHCDPVQMVKLSKGMNQEKARRLAGGIEFPPTERFQKGFSFAIDQKRSAFVGFTDWTPARNVFIDFFCSESLVLMVAYDTQLKIKQIVRISKGMPPPELSQKPGTLRKVTEK